ncbi:MAG: hypothetical protein IJ677_05100 [Alphaproteobacteria bacterium]|nr:hypothetical protein [Alphaproteobacteria bacterium]
MSYKLLSPKEIYKCLAEDTQETLKKALDGCPRDMQGIVFRAVSQSNNVTPDMMKMMLRETECGFKKLEKNYSTGEMEEFDSSPIRDEKNVGDIHNFRPEAISRLKTFVKSQAIKGNEVYATNLLFKIAENTKGNIKDFTEVFKEAVNIDYATDTTLISAVYKTSHLMPTGKGEEACKNFTNEALDVFAEIAKPENAYKHTEETLTDFYYAIMNFASYDAKRVTDLVNKMKDSEKNTDKSLAMANRALLAATKSKTVGNNIQRT